MIISSMTGGGLCAVRFAPPCDVRPRSTLLRFTEASEEELPTSLESDNEPYLNGCKVHGLASAGFRPEGYTAYLDGVKTPDPYFGSTRKNVT